MTVPSLKPLSKATKDAVSALPNKPKMKSSTRKKTTRGILPLHPRNLTVAGACLGVLVSGAMTTTVQASSENGKITELEKQNQELMNRVGALEDLAKKEGIMPSGSQPRFVSAMSDMTISGFVQASYFYNLQHPAGGKSATYLWNTRDNSFSLNKVKLTFAGAPVATDKWDATYRVSLMLGEDAPALDSNGTGNTSFNDLREAYVEMNVPIGTGLDIKAGELISLLNYESGDGGAVNPNFSQGYQWWYTGNGPAAGVQASYNFTDKFGVALRVANGLYQGPVDNNQGKAFLGSLMFKPTDKFWFHVTGWYDDQTGGSSTSGIESIGGYQVTKKLGTGYEVDYFKFASPSSAKELWSVGGWAWYNFTPKVGLAFRADYLSQDHGVIGPEVPGGPGITSNDNGGDLGSLTATLNYRPAPNIKIQPEIRYDYTSYSGGLNGDVAQVILGCGATYLF